MARKSSTPFEAIRGVSWTRIGFLVQSNVALQLDLIEFRRSIGTRKTSFCNFENFRLQRSSCLSSSFRVSSKNSALSERLNFRLWKKRLLTICMCKLLQNHIPLACNKWSRLSPELLSTDPVRSPGAIYWSVHYQFGNGDGVYQNSTAYGLYKFWTIQVMDLARCLFCSGNSAAWQSQQRNCGQWQAELSKEVEP